jgi:hypothetical protein
MRKRGQIGFMSAIALALGSMAIPAQQANASAPASQNVRSQENKEALPEAKKAVRPVKEKNRFGDWSGEQNPYKYTRTPKKNQRQLREYWRQCPHYKKKYK